MRAAGRFREIYAESPVLLAVVLVIAALLGLYWGYRFVGPSIMG
jgi:hypothetical protein